jgi:hypothetical protein
MRGSLRPEHLHRPLVLDVRRHRVGDVLAGEGVDGAPPGLPPRVHPSSSGPSSCESLELVGVLAVEPYVLLDGGVLDAAISVSNASAAA